MKLINKKKDLIQFKNGKTYLLKEALYYQTVKHQTDSMEGILSHKEVSLGCISREFIKWAEENKFFVIHEAKPPEITVIEHYLPKGTRLVKIINSHLDEYPFSRFIIEGTNVEITHTGYDYEYGLVLKEV